jgi:hypothetical protein
LKICQIKIAVEADTQPDSLVTVNEYWPSNPVIFEVEDEKFLD